MGVITAYRQTLFLDLKREMPRQCHLFSDHTSQFGTQRRIRDPHILDHRAFDVEKLVEYAAHQALFGCVFSWSLNILPKKRSSLTPTTVQQRTTTHENNTRAIYILFLAYFRISMVEGFKNMRVLFICTGNICRSPMGELLFRTYTQGTSLEVGSAGTHSLAGHSIDPSSKALMDAVGINSSQFRSTQLTQDIADNSDLILCFEPEQRHNIVVIAPTALPYTFTLTDFSNMCAYCAQHNMITGVTIQERLQSVIDQSMQIRPMLPPSATIPDPYRKNFEAFRSAARATNDAIRNILRSISYNTTPAVQSVKETVQLGNPPHFHGDVVHGDWPLPDLSFDNAVAPADIVVKDNTEVETANTKLIAPDDLPDDVQSDESSDQDEMPVVVEDTSIRDKAAAAEKKSKKRKIIIIASAATVAALLAVGGTVAWHVTSVNAQRDAFSSCKQSATRYAKVKKRYDAAIQNANLLVSVPTSSRIARPPAR